MPTIDDENSLTEQLTIKSIRDCGVTYSFSNGTFIQKKDAWFYPKYPDLTQVVPETDLKSCLERYIAEHRALLSDDAVYLGTWRNPDTGNYHVDINTCDIDKESAAAKARRIGNERGQKILAIYNPFLDKSVKV